MSLTSGAQRLYAEYAWVGGTVVAGVLLEIDGGRFRDVRAVADVPLDAERVSGLVLPGLANAHSHAFHRALRGRTHDAGGSFWTWRTRMYQLADALDPESYFELACGVYAEMALAGITCVGEFHYLHHQAGGVPYTDPNAMSAALVAAAEAAGIRITLLDTCYLTSTVAGEPLQASQRRFGDGDAVRWAERVSGFRVGPHARVGAAIHSVRAVPEAQMAAVVEWAQAARAPLHLHLSEQRAENEACVAHTGRTPTEVLADANVLGPRTVAVHATHLTDIDRTLLGDSGTGVCLCPTTERDLADGIGPARALLDAGSPLSLGSDSHAVIDMFEEARGVEMHERLRTERRGHFTAAELVDAASAVGHGALGWADAGRIEVGARADLVAVALGSARTVGMEPVGAIFAATAADVHSVWVDGRAVVRGGTHLRRPDLASAYARVPA